MKNVTILGAGLSGLAAAQKATELGCDAHLYDKNSYIGGHAQTHETDGFLFDEGPHVSFTKSEEIRDLFAETLKGEFYEHRAKLPNYWRGHWVKHPAQTNLHGLPTEVVVDCVHDMIAAHYEEAGPLRHYADWCRQSLGETFSREFTDKYTRKYWTAEPSNMSTDWVGSRMHRPSIREVLRGAVAPQDVDHHYISLFRYPKKGGFGQYVNSVAGHGTFHPSHTVCLIDLETKTLEFEDGKKVSFEELVSSLPLPELIRRIKDVPKNVLDAANELVCTSLVLVNVGVKRPALEPESHWQYFYDEDILFARGNFPSMLSPANAPEGCSSFQAEVYHSRYRPLEVQDVLNRVLEDATRIGILHEDDEIAVAVEKRIPYANVLFDLGRAKNLAIVEEYVKEKGIHTCGRYGEWKYYWTDDSIFSGRRAGESAAAK
ncbi:NAD(P)-binding protein [bacterium]|nr:NAD(P)-binding protein [bacterium]